MELRTERENSDSRRATVMIGLGAFGLIAPVLTFFLAVSDFPETIKVSVLLPLAFGYSFICFWSFHRSRANADSDVVPLLLSRDAEIEAGLNAMSEASEFFGASL